MKTNWKHAAIKSGIATERANLPPVPAVWRCLSIPGGVRTTDWRHCKTQHGPPPDDRFGLLQIRHDLSQAMHVKIHLIHQPKTVLGDKVGLITQVTVVKKPVGFVKNDLVQV